MSHEIKTYYTDIQLFHNRKHPDDAVDTLIPQAIPGLDMVMKAIRHWLDDNRFNAKIHKTVIYGLPMTFVRHIKVRSFRQPDCTMADTAFTADIPRHIFFTSKIICQNHFLPPYRLNSTAYQIPGCARKPPSTGTVIPVTYAAARSSNSQLMHPISSSGAPNLCIGI